MQNTDFIMRLCGCDVKVTFTNPGDWSRDGMGRANTHTGEIQLNTSLSQVTRAQTFLHELVHMILDWHGFGAESNKEALVNALSLSLLAWMRDNQELVNQISHGVEVPVPA